MTLALIDCPTGLAGDMVLAALLDLGLKEEVIHRPLAALGLEGAYRLSVREGRSGGLRGLRVHVQGLETQPPHRHWRELRERLRTAPLEEVLRQRVLAVFSLLADAEAAVHGHEPEEVHFHEVGAIDALVDIVGVCAGLLHFGVERLQCGVPPAGHGTVLTAHGHLPLPAPAVLEIARRCRIPLAGSGDRPPGELTTPTGLALMACWAERFAPSPAALPLRVGVGLGSRELDRPNLVRLTLATAWEAGAIAAPDAAAMPEGAGLEAAGRQTAGLTGERREMVLQQQCQIDDASGEDLAFLAEALRQAGALEVFSQPIAMKKGRSGVLLTVLAPLELSAALRRVWWTHSTTLGVRESLQPRWLLARSSRRVTTPLGEVGLKRASLPGGGARVKIEHDDLAAIAEGQGLPLAEVRRRVRQALTSSGDPWFPPPVTDRGSDTDLLMPGTPPPLP